MNSAEIEATLKNCEFFKDLEADQIGQISSLCEMRTFEPAQYVFRQGDFGEHIYIIAEGHVCLERSLDLGARTGNVLIGVLGKGRVLGCWSTLLGEPHHLMSSASCQTRTRLLAIRGSDLRKMMLSSARLGLKLLERLCFLLRDRIQDAYGAMEKI